MIVVSPNFNVLNGTLELWLRRNKPSPGTGQRDAEKRAREFIGWQDGVCDVLAAYATERRVKEMGPYLSFVKDQREHFVPGVGSYEVTAWLREITKRWENGEWNDVDDAIFHEQTQHEFDTLVVGGDGFADRVESIRRQAVLDGHLQPTEEDAVWLREQRNALAEVVNPYDAALAKLQG